MKRELITTTLIALMASLIISVTLYLLKAKIEDNRINYYYTILQKATGFNSFKKEDFRVYYYDALNNSLSTTSFDDIKDKIYFHIPTSKILIEINSLGLWGKINGILTLNKEIQSEIFLVYRHNETPGLGAQIESESWQNRWLNVDVFNKIDKNEPIIPFITGATLTSRAVEKMVKDKLVELRSNLRSIYE